MILTDHQVCGEPNHVSGRFRPLFGRSQLENCPSAAASDAIPSGAKRALGHAVKDFGHCKAIADALQDAQRVQQIRLATGVGADKEIELSQVQFDFGQALEPLNGELITFNATASGTEPLDFLWNFGDEITTTGKTVAHSYAQAGAYDIELSAANVCSLPVLESKVITIHQRMWEFFLPVIEKD